MKRRPCRPACLSDDRRQQFVEALSWGQTVAQAAALVGVSRQAAYDVRAQDPAFADAWAVALRTARAAARDPAAAAELGLPTSDLGLRQKDLAAKHCVSRYALRRLEK